MDEVDLFQPAAAVQYQSCWLIPLCCTPIDCREHAPSIIFMDEVDSIGSARTENSGGGGDSEVQRTMLELLNQLDGFEASNKIKVRRFLSPFLCFVLFLLPCDRVQHM
jgi:hypothetical protein